MSKPYYTLLIWDHDLAKWCPEFGDYNRSDVRQEVEDCFPDDRWKIIKTTDDQFSIDLGVVATNKREQKVRPYQLVAGEY